MPQYPGRWAQQPDEGAALAGDGPLSLAVTHLFHAPALADLVTEAGVATANAGGVKLVESLGMTCAVEPSGYPKLYFPQSVGLVNSGLPWTLAAIIVVDPSISGVLDHMITTSDTAGAISSAHDRGLGFIYSSGFIYLRGTLYDGGTKTVQHQTAIDFSAPRELRVVISSGGGYLRCWVDGVPCSTPTAVAGNGYTGYSSAYLNIGADACSGYKYALVARTDGYAWGDEEALAFADDPWQLFAPRSIWVPALQSIASGLCLVGGELQMKASLSGSDRKVFLSSAGALVSRTSAAAGDRGLSLSGGSIVAGAPA